MKITKAFFGPAFFIVAIFIATAPGYAQQRTPPKHTLIIFYSHICSDCVEIKAKIMPAVENDFRDKIIFDYRDTTGNMSNYKMLLSLQKKYNRPSNDILPVFYSEGRFLNGEGDVNNNLRAFIQQIMALPVSETEKESTPAVDLVQYFKTFTPWAIIGVGLIDGINPCAITVIVFFMSFLAFQGYRKQEIVLIGMIFIFSVYLTYVLIGLGIFEFLYRLQGFWLISKIVNITVGLISITFSGYATYDFIKFRKTQATDDLLLSLPEKVKNQIHKVIGSQYRINRGAKGFIFDRNMMRLALSALITGFLVSVLEAVCVVKIYLPTIIFVLKTTELKLKALIYLLLYNLLFIFPLLAVFFFALAGTSSQKFQALLRGHLGTIKILMAVLFLGLGIFLIWRA
jgi:glutaredoxin-related protein